jgi:hypothetical protein
LIPELQWLYSSHCCCGSLLSAALPVLLLESQGAVDVFFLAEAHLSKRHH